MSKQFHLSEACAYPLQRLCSSHLLPLAWQRSNLRTTPAPPQPAQNAAPAGTAARTGAGTAGQIQTTNRAEPLQDLGSTKST